MELFYCWRPYEGSKEILNSDHSAVHQELGTKNPFQASTFHDRPMLCPNLPHAGGSMLPMMIEIFRGLVMKELELLKAYNVSPKCC